MEGQKMNEHQSILNFIRELKNNNNPPCPKCHCKDGETINSFNVHHFHCKNCGFTLNID